MTSSLYHLVFQHMGWVFWMNFSSLTTLFIYIRNHLSLCFCPHWCHNFYMFTFISRSPIFVMPPKVVCHHMHISYWCYISYSRGILQSSQYYNRYVIYNWYFMNAITWKNISMFFLSQSTLLKLLLKLYCMKNISSQFSVDCESIIMPQKYWFSNIMFLGPSHCDSAHKQCTWKKPK